MQRMVILIALAGVLLLALAVRQPLPSAAFTSPVPWCADPPVQPCLPWRPTPPAPIAATPTPGARAVGMWYAWLPIVAR